MPPTTKPKTKPNARPRAVNAYDATIEREGCFVLLELEGRRFRLSAFVAAATADMLATKAAQARLAEQRESEGASDVG